MRLKRSALEPCPRCHERKFLDWKFDWGGGRYMDKYAIECVVCGPRSESAYSQAEAIAAWNAFVGKNRVSS